MNLKQSKSKLTCCGADCPNKEVSTIFKGKKFYFCDTSCLKEFKKNPERFLNSTHFRMKFEDLENA